MSDNAEKNVNRTSRKSRREKKMSRKAFWLMVLAIYLVIMAVVIIFVKSGDSDDLYKAHWKKGAEVITMGGVDYSILSASSSDTYIGSLVSDRLNGVKKEKIASIRSYLLYVSVFFSLENDPELDYIVDGKGTLYTKSNVLEAAKKYTDDYSNMNVYKMTSSAKDLDTMNTISEEEVQYIDKLSGEEIIITDKKITEDYENRREIYGFYDNNILYRARYELFKYKGEIYKTTFFVDANKNKGTTTLKGIKLSEEYQSKFEKIWD